MTGTYLKVIGCLGVALVVLLVGDMDFKIVDGFVMGLWTGFTSVVVNVNGLRGGAGALREPTDSNKSFPVMSTLRIVFAAFKILRHLLDFRSSVSCLKGKSGQKISYARMKEREKCKTTSHH